MKLRHWIVIAVVAGAGLLTFTSGALIQEQVRPEQFTSAQYQRLQTGMSYSRVMEIMGQPGEEVSTNDIAGVETTAYQWRNPSGSNMIVIFQNGELVSKSQAGLR